MKTSICDISRRLLTAGSLSVLSLSVVVSVGIAGCGIFDDDEGEGSVAFTVETSDSPANPDIAIPSNTKRFIMELIDEKGKNSDADDSDSDSDADEKIVAAKDGVADDSPNRSARNSGPLNTLDGDDDDQDTDVDSGTVMVIDGVETTCASIPASYSLSQNYVAGEEVKLALDKIPSGSWVVRVSAIDENDCILGAVQKNITISNGKDVSVSGWLNSGPAPEGYLFMANPSGKSVVCLSLFSEETMTLPTAGHAPAILFFKQSLSAPLGSLLYAITGAADLLELKVSTYNTDCDVTEQYLPSNNVCVAPGSEAVVSYYKEGGVRFYDYDTAEYSDFVKTDEGASEFSNIVNDIVWVTNDRAKTLSKIDIASRTKIGSNITTGYSTYRLQQNNAGTRIWTIGTEPQPNVHVIDSNGELVDHYTTQIVSPADILIVDDMVCVADSSRNEVVIFGESDKCSEIERIPVAEGVGDQLFSDGQRLYVLTAKKSLAVIDLTTLTYNKVISISGDCSDMVWMH